MKISVIMGIYNCEKTLKESIDSLLNQSYKSFEIILCDDGSKDTTLQIAKDYVKKYPQKIRLIQNETNNGLAYSLNRCIDISKGEYIARMDADDVSYKNRLEKQISYLESHPECALVGSQVFLFNDNGIWGVRKAKSDPLKKDFLFGSQFVHPTIIIKKTILNQIGNYTVSKATLRAEDYDLFMRVYAAGFRGHNLQDVLLNYREDNATFKRRAYNYRLDEAKVRYNGFKKMKLMPLGLLYVLKPLIVGLIPQAVLTLLRHQGLEKNSVDKKTHPTI
ncbi:glycosyltransferase EpsE [Carnobacterium alterfunditum]|uniref:Glycosyltransferase EpsE n=1 Tax=Carnobacterium alterfunditum TaxID=28230 RepID=A0A1N6HDB5_9LACT|nr:glycosyltransferase [Carnobacterium alterfunditum]SIO17831.1 glycosyltransferase EpsE [Carnobacterium alterfunditum]